MTRERGKKCRMCDKRPARVISAPYERASRARLFCSLRCGAAFALCHYDGDKDLAEHWCPATKEWDLGRAADQCDECHEPIPEGERELFGAAHRLKERYR